MSILINVLSAVLGLLGALFVIGSQGQVGRIIIGIILIAAGIVLFATGHIRQRREC